MTLRRPFRTLSLAAGLILPIALAAHASEATGQPNSERYQKCDPLSLTVPRRPVTRNDYVDYVRPWAEGFESGPDRGQYGPRHALPALAVFALEGNRELGEGIKKTLKHYADWVHACVEKDRGVFSMEGATLCSLHFRELRRQGLMTPEDEAWTRRLLLALREFHFAWRPGDGLWRGSHHRSQCQGINHALAAAFYPGEPDVPQWKAYADAVWADWWDFRDVGINDTGYFYSSFGNVLRAAELLGRKEVFTDRESRQVFDRIMFEVTPDGAGVPYGAHGGYNSHAGSRIFALELAARYTRDGRYRWVAHRLMNFGQARGFSNNHHHVQALSIEDLALAGLVCDDSVVPVEPDGASKLLTRKEIVRLTNDEAKAMFPDAGGVDCNMFMTQKVMPHKLVLRSGWNPGDLYMLVECYPRHDPLNPTAILALERYSAAFAEMTSEKFISRENAVAIQDLSGDAVYLGQKDFRGEKKLPVGWAGMEASVPAFSDHALATRARIRVTGYMGYEATHERELLFVKNHFVLVRDETIFRDRFRARVGPVWNTQNVGDPRGANWLNTWFSAHFFQKARLYETPPWDLLIYHAPHADRKLIVSPANESPDGPGRLVATRYAWEGDVEPGKRLQFVQVLLPHAPTPDATALAEGIEVLADEPGLAAVCVHARLEQTVAGTRRVPSAGYDTRRLRATSESTNLSLTAPLGVNGGDGPELAILNRTGKKLDLDIPGIGPVSTDAEAAYVQIRANQPPRALAVHGMFLTVGAKTLFKSQEPQDFEASP